MASRSEYEITGPGTGNGIPASSYNVALSRAQTMATRPGTTPGAWYVRNGGGRSVAIVERHEDGLVTTTPTRNREEN